VLVYNFHNIKIIQGIHCKTKGLNPEFHLLIPDVLTLWLNKTAWQRSPGDHPGRIEVVEQVDKVIAEGVKLQKVGVSKRDGFPVSTK